MRYSNNGLVRTLKVGKFQLDQWYRYPMKQFFGFRNHLNVIVLHIGSFYFVWWK